MKIKNECCIIINSWIFHWEENNCPSDSLWKDEYLQKYNTLGDCNFNIDLHQPNIDTEHHPTTLREEDFHLHVHVFQQEASKRQIWL